MREEITLMNINHARALLSETQHAMLAIAMTVGFNSVSRFYETFHRTLGMTPRQYRQQTCSSSRPANRRCNALRRDGVGQGRQRAAW